MQNHDCSFLNNRPLIAHWFDQSSTHIDYRTTIYRKRLGCAEEAYLKYLFLEMEQNIERVLKHRCQPGYVKEIGANARMYVGSMTHNQWEIYKSAKKQSSTPPDAVRSKKFKVPGFDDLKVPETHEYIEWESTLPRFEHNPCWWINKWVDDMSTCWRSWILCFSLVWNSFNQSVYITFKYRCQHYSHHYQRWIYV
jgi:hypothetical protein